MRYFIENKTYEYYVGKYPELENGPHIHTHLEMIYLTKGRANAAVDGTWYPMEEGDLFLAGPNQIHHYEQLGDVEFFLVIFDSTMDPDLLDFLKGKQPVSAVIPAARLPKDLHYQLEQISHKHESKVNMEHLEARSRMLTVFSQVLPLFSYVKETAASPDSIKAILAYCSEHFTEPITLEDAARQLHLSKYYICHIFRQRMNTGFTNFINQQRAAYACDLMKLGRSITDAAFTSGFSSIRTFNRVFRKETGLSPREFLSRNRTQNGN